MRTGKRGSGGIYRRAAGAAGNGRGYGGCLELREAGWQLRVDGVVVGRRKVAGRWGQPGRTAELSRFARPSRGGGKG